MSWVPLTNPVKLVSDRGDVLGTITVPEGWLRTLDERRTVEFMVRKREYCFSFCHSEPETLRHYQQAMVSSAALVRSAWPDYEGRAVVLRGVDLETFEKQPGCSFAPGIAFTRSLLQK